MIREAIHRELARNGQVYYVYNRVRSIDEVAAHIEELVPEAMSPMHTVRWKNVCLKKSCTNLSMEKLTS